MNRHIFTNLPCDILFFVVSMYYLCLLRSNRLLNKIYGNTHIQNKNEKFNRSEENRTIWIRMRYEESERQHRNDNILKIYVFYYKMYKHPSRSTIISLKEKSFMKFFFRFASRRRSEHSFFHLIKLCNSFSLFE